MIESSEGFARASTRRDLPVLLITPAYNEAANIEPTLSEIRQHVPRAFDLLVVNDCSSDETASLARQAGALVLSLSQNLGYGGAVETGLKYAVRNGYALAVLVDGDGQHDPRCISDLVDVVAHDQADVAVGSRFLGQLEYRVPRLRRWGMATMSKLASVFCGQKITDPTSGSEVNTISAVKTSPGKAPVASKFVGTLSI